MKEWGVGRWLVPVPSDFELRMTEDSTQFTNGKRTIFVGTIDVLGKNGRPDPPAAELHNVTGRGDVQEELAGPDKWGWWNGGVREAGLRHVDATRESDGSILNCTFTFDVDDKGAVEWAKDIWRGIRRD